MAGRCKKSELQYFAPLEQQFDIVSTQEVVYSPVNSISETPRTIEFLSLGAGEAYKDLSSIYVKLQIQLLKNDKGEPHTNSVAAPATASVVNGLFFALFKQVNVYLNNVPISQTSNDYGYRALFTTLMNYGSDSSSTHLETIGWDLDSGKVDALTADNPSYLSRQRKLAESKIIEYFGPLHIDLASQSKLLLNNIDLRIVMTLQNPSFYILEPEGGTSRVKILNAQLFMNHVHLNPHSLLANEMRLTKQMALFPHQRIELRTHTIPAGGLNISIDNLIIGQLPNFLLFSMVDNDAYSGNITLNPFNFKHNNISSFQLIVNGLPVPLTPLDFDYSQTPPISTRGYQTLFRGTGIHYFDRGHQISKTYFDNGCFLLAFDLSVDQNQDGACVNPSNQGTIRIEARFREALPKTVTCIIYASYDGVLKIDKQRNIYTQF